MESFYILLTTLLIVIILWSYNSWKKSQEYWKKRGISQISSNFPLVGNIWPSVFFSKSLVELYRDFYEIKPKDSMVGLYNLNNPELFLRDVELIKSVLQTNFQCFQKNAMELIAGEKDSLLSLNPFVLEGEQWRNARSVLTNSMSSAKLRNMSLAVRDVCYKLKNFVDEEVKLNGGKYEIDAQELFSRFTSEVVASAGFGIDGHSFSKNGETVLKMSKQIFEPSMSNTLKSFVQFFCPRLASLLGLKFLSTTVENYFRGIVKDVLETRKKSGQRGNDFLQQICDGYKSKDGEINEHFVTCHATSFLLDGYLTSSYTLSLIMSQIALYQNVQTKLREEVKTVLDKHKEINYDSINEMKYLDQVIKEGMRLLPVLAVMQKLCTQECKLVGFDGVEVVMKPGDRVSICPLALHLDENHWEDPNVFDPERFNDDNKNEYNKFAFLSWGGGPRACVGMRIALIQMKAAIATLVQHYLVKLSQKTKLPIKLVTSGIFNVADGGVYIEIKPL